MQADTDDPRKMAAVLLRGLKGTEWVEGRCFKRVIYGGVSELTLVA